MLTITAIPAFSDNYIWMGVRDDRAWVVDPGDANPVMAVLQARGLILDTILITHHHFDHTGGVNELKVATQCRVVGPNNPKISDIDEVAVDGDCVDVLGVELDVLEVPGHTLDHIAYYNQSESVLFCGDTLFVGGCGRVFEGTFPMMQGSLAKLKALPPTTKVYCTHEYTLANLAFAQKVEPNNAVLAEHARNCAALRDRNIPTVPSSIEVERAINPFLRWDSDEIVTNLMENRQLDSRAPTDVFAAVRGWKDEG
ncbi:MAG: hydroxyacylglutathione hydrolase [Luminiphilus sp.]|nr:hydroxyacylglutathione hydrolase [Luminiphilus sp.]